MYPPAHRSSRLYRPAIGNTPDQKKHDSNRTQAGTCRNKIHGLRTQPAPQAGPDSAEVSSPAAPSGPPAIWASTELPEAPFTAWTTSAPATLVGPGGVTVDVMRNTGVRVEVLQVLDARLRVRCTGCTHDTEEPPEGWLTRGSIRAADDHGEPNDLLSAVLRQRAAWAGGAAAPEGFDNNSLCELADRGLLPGRSAEEGVLQVGEARARFAWTAEGWELAEVGGEAGQRAWSCRTTRPSQRGSAAPR